MSAAVGSIPDIGTSRRPSRSRPAPAKPSPRRCLTPNSVCQAWPIPPAGIQAD